MKRLFTILFATILAGQAWAANPYYFEYGGLLFNYVSQTEPYQVKVVYKSLEQNYNNTAIGIPSRVTVDGKTYTVTEISNQAFKDCKNLKMVEIPSTVTTIGQEAFSGCTALKNVVVPESVTSIESDAFPSTTIICCAASNQPTGWNSNWCPANTMVVWSVKTLNNFIYKIADESLQTIEIVGCRGDDENLTIPETITVSDADYTVTSIGDYAFKSCNKQKSITIPNTIESIGNSAFSGCSGLTTISIPNSVINIGDKAFYGCSSLTKATFASIESLCATNFSDAYSNPLSYAHHLYIGDDEVTELTISDITSIGAFAFYGCNAITALDISNSVTEVGDDAFNGCSGLTSITITSNADFSNGNLCFKADKIKYKIFNKSSVEVVAVPKSGDVIIPATVDFCGNTYIVTSIDVSAFNNCNFTSLTINADCEIDFSNVNFTFINNNIRYKILNNNSVEVVANNYSGKVTIPSTVDFCGNTYVVANISSDAFVGCTNLDYTLYDGCKYIGTEDNPYMLLLGLQSTSASVAYIHDQCKCIGDNAFKNCYSLELVEMSNSITTIGKYAFVGCSRLESITISETVTGIGEGAFSGCSKLTSVNLPDGITKLDNKMFQGCSNLSSITIPESVTSIGDWAFGDCISLTSVTIPNSVTSIGRFAFDLCRGLLSVTFGDSVTSIGDNAFRGCKNLTMADFASLESLFSIEMQDHPFLSANESLICHLHIKGEEVTDITIPETIISIRDNVLRKCSNITSVTIPNSVTSIGNAAFQSCTNLSSVTIPNSVTSIGDWAFCNCSKLSSISIPETVTNIGIGAFSGCSELSLITIPNSVTSIGNNAFYNCGLETVEIPNSVTDIGESAFNKCSNLSLVVIPNSVKTMGRYAFSYYQPNSSYNNRSKKITFYCEASSKPDGWNYEWRKNDNMETVYWGVKPKFSNDFVYNVLNDANPYEIELYKFVGNNIAIIPSSEVFNGIDYQVVGYGTDVFTSYSQPIICQSTTPVALTEDPFPNNNIIYVPATSVNAYKTSAIWKRKEIKPFYVVSAKSADEAKGIVQGDSLLLDNLTLTAIPAEGYHFVSWSDGNKDAVRELTEAPNTTLVATFEAHTEVTDSAVAATCTTTGLTEGSHCSGCDMVFVAQTETPMIEHMVVVDPAVGATFTTTGLTEGSHCSVCGNVIVAQDVVPVLSQQFTIDNLRYVVTSTEQPYTAAVVGGNGTDIVIPETVTYNNLVISVTSISEEAFWRNGNLKSVVIGDAVTKIGDMAFSQCPGITSITIGKSVVHIGANAFNQSGITTIIIPESVNTIDDAAFLNCGSLTSITIPKSVTKMGSSVFQFCTNLTITCEVESKPDGWESGWNSSKCTVIWAEPQNNGEESGENGGDEENVEGPTAVNESAANAINIYAHGNTIVVENATEEIRVYNAMGALVGRDVARNVSTITVNGTGVYIVKTGGVVKRVVVD